MRKEKIIMKQITKKQAKDLLNSTNGKLFSAIFTKKDGTERKMTARIGVSKGVKGTGLKFAPSQYDLLPVFDIKADGYRMLNLKTLKALQVNKKFYVVEG